MSNAGKPVLLVLLLLFSGCAGTPTPPLAPDDKIRESNDNAIREQSEILRQIEKQIILGTSESLTRALEKLSSDEIGECEKGRELNYLGRQFFSLLYPHKKKENGIPSAPAGSIYPDIFSSVKNGTFFEGSLMNESFFFLVSKSMVVLYSDDPETNDLVETSLRSALSKEEKSVIPYYLLGIVKRRQGELRAAYENITTALEIGPDMDVARLELARIYAVQNRYEEAIETIEPLFSLFPNDIELFRIAAEAYYHRGRYEEALSYTDSLISLSDDPSYLLLRLKILYRQESYERAKKILKIVDTGGLKTAEARYIQADIYYKTGEPLKALELLSDAYVTFPESLPIREFYGRLLFENGNENRGISVLEDVLDLEPESVSTLNLLLDYSIQREEWESAERYVERLLQLKKTPELMITAFSVYSRTGNTEEARQTAEELYAIDDDNPRYSIPHIRALIEQGNSTEAALAVRRGLASVESRKPRSELYYLLSLTMDDERERIRQLQNALFEDLRNREALVAISDLYRQLGDYPKALRYIKQAENIDPADSEIRRKRLELEQRVE